MQQAFYLLAHNPYAIVSYISDYVMKDETALTQMLKDVLHKTKHLSMIEQLNALKQAWMKYRQIGCSEAVYRLLSALHLISSNISCIFVASGYPENRSVFFQKVNDNSEKIVELDKSFEKGGT